MESTKVSLQIQNTGISPDGSALLLSETTAEKWTIPFHEPLTLTFGSASQEVMVEPSPDDGVLLMCASLASKWGLAHGDELCLQFNSDSRTIRIGPLIGVMLKRIYRKMPHKPFGVNTAFCRELTEACKQQSSIIYFFTHEDIQSQSESIKGWHYTGNKWSRSRFPVPNVIYNRLTSRKLENRANVQQFVKYARSRYNVVFFNEKYLNKTEVFNALNKEPELHAYLPESYLLRNFHQLKSMFRKYDVVFLKPTCGSLGKGIIRIQRNSNQTYTCYFNGMNGYRTQWFVSLEKLYNAIYGKVKKSNFQIQRGLKLLTVNGRPVDFRALVQRGETGQWGITSIVARIAATNQFVSNQARGGTISTVQAALSRTGTSAASGGLTKLRRAAVQIAEGIEAQLTGHFAELGIDLGIDSQGRVWLIEVNSKPSKDDKAPLTEGKIRPSVRKFVQYANFSFTE
jgi:glutathione synthase/RimK-type ligase-like ATP-grasp enzyme